MLYYIPIASMYCDADGYVSVKEEPKAGSGSCVYYGKNVKIGPFDLLADSPELFTYLTAANLKRP